MGETEPLVVSEEPEAPREKTAEELAQEALEAELAKQKTLKEYIEAQKVCVSEKILKLCVCVSDNFFKALLCKVLADGSGFFCLERSSEVQRSQSWRRRGGKLWKVGETPEGGSCRQRRGRGFNNSS